MSNRNPEYQFVSTDTDALVSLLVSVYEKTTGTTVQPASPERLFIQWVSNIIVQERVINNKTGNQNIPSRAEGKNLDALGELFKAHERAGAKAAVSKERVTISAPQESAVLISAGTRFTDESATLTWETMEDAYVPIGETAVDVPIRCQTKGTIGNGYTPGQINKLVDLFDFYLECENITESDGGAEEATDEEYYETLRLSMDGYSTAGATGGYIYWAKQVSTEIADVIANSPTPGVVKLFVLMKDGTIATDELKSQVLAACSADDVRPLTDYVSVDDAESVSYDVEFTYYIQSGGTKSAADIAADVQAAVGRYTAWQCAKLGRDINPSELYHLLMETGIKRLELASPAFTVLRDGSNGSVPQVAALGSVTITNGGHEDE